MLFPEREVAAPDGEPNKEHLFGEAAGLVYAKRATVGEICLLVKSNPETFQGDSNLFLAEIWGSSWLVRVVRSERADFLWAGPISANIAGGGAVQRRTQSHGLNSKVYVPIINRIFKERYIEGIEFIDFTLDDVRLAADQLGVKTRNPGDVVYRMRARTELPEAIRAAGFFIIRQVGARDVPTGESHRNHR